MPPHRLDPKLLKKVALKLKKNPDRLREQLSRRANKFGTSSEAELYKFARDAGIGATNFLRKQAANIQDQVRGSLVPVIAPPPKLEKKIVSKTTSITERKALAWSVDYLLKDKELKDRCGDLLLANSHFDRVFREATTVFDDRLKRVSGISNMNPQNLVGKALNPDPLKAVIEISQNKDEQEGFYSLCKGIISLFRNKTHHNLTDKFSREDALKFCGFIDTILFILDNATVHVDRV